MMVDTFRSPAEASRERVLRELDAVAGEFPAIPRGVVERHVDDVLREFAGARLTDYVPLLVYRRVRRRLAKLEPASGPRRE